MAYTILFHLVRKYGILSSYTDRGEVPMKKHSFLFNTSYPLYANLWLMIYLTFNIIFGTSFFFTRSLVIPHIALALINLYAILLLTKENHQGFYTLCSSELIFVVYSLTLANPTPFLSISTFNFFCILITWFCVRHIWK